MDEKQQRDQMRAERKKKEEDAAEFEAAREKSRNRINKASLKKIAREKKRALQIQQGLINPDDPVRDADDDWISSDDPDQDAEDVGKEEDDSGEKNEEDHEQAVPKIQALVSQEADADALQKEEPESHAFDDQGASKLHYAAMTGKEEKVEQLLRENADPNVRDNDGMTPLHYAAGDGHFGIIALMVGKFEAALDIADKDGDMAIHIAVQEGHLRCLEEICRNRPDLVNVKGYSGNTPLHLAAGTEHDNSEMVTWLLENKAGAFIENEEGLSALQLAEERADSILNHPHFALMKNFLGIKDQVGGPSGGPLKPIIAEKLWGFIERDEIDNVVAYLRGGIDIDGRLDDTKVTSLMLAVNKKKIELVKELVDPQWNADINIADASGRSALHFCVLHGEDTPEDMLEMILARNPNANLPDQNAYTPLHYAAERCPVKILQTLKEKTVLDALAATDHGHNALHLAAWSSRLQNVGFLLEILRGSAAGNVTFVDPEMALHDAVNRMDNEGNTALHLAARAEENLEMCKLLLECGANPRQINKSEMSALDIATAQKHKDLINLLSAAQRKEPGAGMGADLAKTLMLITFAIKDGDVKKVKLHLEHIAKAFLESEQGAGLDSEQAQQQVKAFLNLPSDEVEDTLLHKAAAAGRTEIIKLLWDRGASMLQTNKLGCTPLHAAAMHGQKKAIEWMLDKQADPRANDSEGYCPMHYAAGEGHLDAIDILLRKGACNPELKTFQGLTMMHIAVSENQESVVKYLLANSPRTHRGPHFAAIPDADRVLPIQYAKAADERNEEIINALAVSRRQRPHLRICFTSAYLLLPTHVPCPCLR